MTVELDTHPPASPPSVPAVRLRRFRSPLWIRGFRSAAGTTPGRLRALLAAMLLAILVVCLTGAEAVADLRNTTVTAADRTSPTVIDAALVRVLLADADRVAVQGLLPTAGGQRTTNGPGGAYQDDIKSVEQALERARTTGLTGLPMVQTVNDQMVLYVGDVAQAQAYAAVLAASAGSDSSPGSDSSKTVDLSVVYLSYAAEQLRTSNGALATVEKFRLENRSRLPNRGWGPWPLLVVQLTLGTVLLGLVVGAQLFLRRRFHRRVSLELAGIAAIVVLICGWTTAQSVSTSRALDEGVRETDRVTCLSQARALAALADRDYRYGAHPTLVASTARPPQEGACATATPNYQEHPTAAQAARFLDGQDSAEVSRELRTFLSAPPAANDHDSAYLRVDRSLRQLQENHLPQLTRAWDDALPSRGLEWILIACSVGAAGLTLVAFVPRLREYRKSS
ncbi:hypothetical protein I6A60_35715 [Frankia sp. AgB1.9]|uniref:hypothetical protein n=1 Tax=unclassified Frankia TaxID=2632575 RepID=UPI001933397F|nr:MULTISPECIES: hypothetical protein [unclassified Frankia]MBL7489985.1 hypothetical protein [Frankia sp. AgW1.1]MBL7553161.1 hypothetical protein [Frankia sp. AgB1.9]MBL7622196.1 hypothetical protein [Frankia sp. AgB1.8]